MKRFFTAMIATFTAVLFFADTAPANAQIAYTYYTAQSNGRDFGPVICCFANNNEVLNTLGPNGLPVYNPASTPVLQDRDPTTNELLWWTPSASTAPLYVQQTSNGLLSSNSFSNSNFFPPNGGGSSDANGFQTAVFSGNFTFATAQNFTFSLSADDDALLFVDGTAAVILGGIHPQTPSTNSVSLGAGAHSFELFYADRQQTGAGLAFSIPDSVIITPPSPSVPEPASWALMIGGFGLVGGVLRVRRRTVMQTA